MTKIIEFKNVNIPVGLKVYNAIIPYANKVDRDNLIYEIEEDAKISLIDIEDDSDSFREIIGLKVIINFGGCSQQTIDDYNFKLQEFIKSKNTREIIQFSNNNLIFINTFKLNHT